MIKSGKCIKNGGILAKSHRFLLKINDLEQIYITFQQTYPRFGNSEVIFLRYMDISMAHLRTKKVLRRI